MEGGEVEPKDDKYYKNIEAQLRCANILIRRGNVMEISGTVGGSGQQAAFLIVSLSETYLSCELYGEIRNRWKNFVGQNWHHLCPFILHSDAFCRPRSEKVLQPRWIYPIEIKKSFILVYSGALKVLFSTFSSTNIWLILEVWNEDSKNLSGDFLQSPTRLPNFGRKQTDTYPRIRGRKVCKKFDSQVCDWL